MLVVLVYILHNLDLCWLISLTQGIERLLMLRCQDRRSSALTIDVISCSPLHPHCIGHLAEAASRHFARVSRRILLLGRVSLLL